MMFSIQYNTNIPFVQNAIGCDAFRQIRQFIHFTDNNKLPRKGALGWDPLQKVTPVIDAAVLVALAAAWVLGKRTCVDESMIKYMVGRAISFMSVKPIKYGIKMFALCCASTGYLYNFEIYYKGSESITRGWVTAISSHEIVLDYSKCMVGGVDHKDQDTADWTVSLKPNRWYLQVLAHRQYSACGTSDNLLCGNGQEP
jgi:hypothetical protein